MEDATGDESALRARDVARERFGGSRTFRERPHGVDDVCRGVYRKCDDGIEWSLCGGRRARVSGECGKMSEAKRERLTEATTARVPRSPIVARRLTCLWFSEHQPIAM